MTRIAFFILLTNITFGCSNSDLAEYKTTTFKSFEVSYTNGWTKGFSLFVDSNKIYLLPQRWDTTYFGILPDTIFRIIDTTFLKIQSDKQIKSKDGGCVDCPILALKIISKGDTIRINQIGKLDSIFYPLIKSLQTFVDKSRHQSIRSVVWLDTKFIVSPPPPPVDENTKFTPSPASKQSGR